MDRKEFVSKIVPAGTLVAGRMLMASGDGGGGGGAWYDVLGYCGMTSWLEMQCFYSTQCYFNSSMNTDLSGGYLNIGQGEFESWLGSNFSPVGSPQSGDIQVLWYQSYAAHSSMVMSVVSGSVYTFGANNAGAGQEFGYCGPNPGLYQNGQFFAYPDSIVYYR